MPSTIPLVIPVRFSGRLFSVQTTTGRISEESVFVRSLDSPKEGSSVSLQLALPGSRGMLDATGIVSPQLEPSANEHGFWVKFDALPQPTRALLDALLQERRARGPLPPAHASPANRRAYARRPARLRVGWTSSRNFLVAYSENISRGGIFIAMNEPPPLHEVVELSVELPDGHSPVRTHAEIAHCVTPQETRFGGGVSGVGLQFIGASDEFRQRLDACIEDLTD